MMPVLFEKDTQAHCKFCEDHIFTFNKDIYSGDKMASSQIYQDKGQAPWKPGEAFICRKCRKPLYENLLFFKKDGVK